VFSACFGESLLPLHPTVYAEMLATNIRKYNTKCWLVNTGWTGGKFGTGKVMELFHKYAKEDETVLYSKND
jgi:phosphoenolpyruvate carboxykinase (ATP)